jgi:hypothetical protein
VGGGSVRRVTYPLRWALSAGRLARMGVIYEVLLGLVLPSRRDRLPFGDAEQQAPATDGSDG